MKAKQLKSKSYVAIGLMSGTSLDGLDAALVKLTPRGNGYDFKVLSFTHTSFPKAYADTARLIAEKNLLLESRYLGSVWSQVAWTAIRRVARSADISISKIDVIGAHGQTVLHRPLPVSFLGKKVTTTVQLADLSLLAAAVGRPVVGDFRLADLAAGGQGAPLAGHAHRFFFGQKGMSIAVHNLGGIGNVTLLKEKIVDLSFDTGPANAWIDAVCRLKSSGKIGFDRNGTLAAKGRTDEKAVKTLLLHPYFQKKPPKSCGWEEFGPPSLARVRSTLARLRIEDAVATVTQATVEATARAYKNFVFPKARLSQVILCGGGAKNGHFLRQLQKRLEVKVSKSDDAGLAADQVEAASFALLAVETIRGQTGNEPKATGAKRSAVLGVIAPPPGQSLRGNVG